MKLDDRKEVIKLAEFFNKYGIELRPEDFLIKSNERVPKETLVGDEQVLNAPVIEKAFQGILNDFKPYHNKAIFSLCTSTRPYLDSVKWKTYNELFGNECDLIICSNGGIIPVNYMNCYPFHDYNAPHEGNKWDDLYKQVFERRLVTFLEKNRKYYDKLCFVFIPDTRNYTSIEKLQKTNNLFEGSALIPDRETYKKVLNNEDLYIGFPVQRYPTLSTSVLLQMDDYLQTHSSKLQKLIQSYANKPNKDLGVRDILQQVYDKMEFGRGYQMTELLQMGMTISSVYKSSTITGGVKASTNNIELKGTGLGQYNRNLFHKHGELFYKFGSLEEFRKHVKEEDLDTPKLF